MSRIHAELVMREGLADKLFSRDAARRMAETTTAQPSAAMSELQSNDARSRLGLTEMLITGWGAPRVDAEILAAAPRLRAIVHACGSVKDVVSEASWAAGVTVSSAATANAAPVAEYALAMILLAGKGVFGLQDRYRTDHRSIDPVRDCGAVGNYGRRVGIIGASQVGRRVVELLRPHDLAVSLADPYVDLEGASMLGVELCDLDELLASCDVVSVHAPQLPSTHHLLDARRLALLPDGATLINTARGTLIDENSLTEHLTSGRLNAVLDVTEAEPLSADSSLWSLPNVIITPHVAGSLGNELMRMGDSAVAELERFAAGRAFAHQVHHQDLERLA